ncbi:MAG: bifunctional chorismate mutase/prephenate dehydrogenase [Lysobacterales bacterium CG17_big_fil_post_rev_8_21_14_2_50_64_11]|nr:MAG: bifunctional chorismate mutase/prephenate dehydrogenase [Xanthomonadales bacterium CG17_big_fil_post_rev_8_21_14_2_50_64_11]PIX59273.1 MAG: bifunctional chorismate mutase/prephenate dehydrogenase [Xanthomonadales bacterium CG_4_10_14_3_um_filter_64_11]
MTASLFELRTQIDQLDQRLIALLGERATLTRAVGEYKHRHGLPLYAPEREAQLLGARREQARAAGLDPALLEDILRRVMRDSYASQQAQFPATGDSSRAVVIVGGGGALGQLLSGLFARSGYPVHVLEKDDWAQAPAWFANAGLVLLAVPIEHTCAIIRALPALPADCVLADITSIKRAPLNAMLESHPGPVVGLHPMFGPDVGNLAKQVVVVCHGRDPQRCQWLLEQFTVWGAVLREEQPERHDRAMVLIQAMRHFSSMVYGVFLQREGADLHELMRLSSPIYRLELAMVGRLFAQNPALYADIILAAEHLPDLIDQYRHTLDALLAMVRDADRAALIAQFNDTSAFFGDLAPALLHESADLLRKAHDARDPG